MNTQSSVCYSVSSPLDLGSEWCEGAPIHQIVQSAQQSTGDLQKSCQRNPPVDAPDLIIHLSSVVSNAVLIISPQPCGDARLQNTKTPHNNRGKQDCVSSNSFLDLWLGINYY